MKALKKLTALAVIPLSLVATNAHAGAIADAVTSATTDFKADFTAVGGIVVGLALIGIGFVAAVRMLRRGI